MSFLVNTTYRSDAVELMDDFSVGGDLLRDTLDKLDNINKWLGGNQVTVNGIKKIIKTYPKEKPISILDLGCGSGDMLRQVAVFGLKNGYTFKLIGIDANAEAIKYAKELSADYKQISFLELDIFSDEFKELEYDVVLTTLFLHHFKEDQLVELLKQVLDKSSVGIVVNDLHRHSLAYYLFKLLGLVIKNDMVKQDGLTSILRGFKRSDLEEISKRLKLKSQIQWRWAFRYQWIIKK
jgi:2-polyprenyl-3-methyl-5-hydroxy-6-metoxy-1,4-benzoquinol methylase